MFCVKSTVSGIEAHYEWPKTWDGAGYERAANCSLRPYVEGGQGECRVGGEEGAAREADQSDDQERYDSIDFA